MLGPGRYVSSHINDHAIFTERGMRQLKPDRTYSAGETVYTNFCTFVDSAHIVDEFLLAFILYFRFFFRVDRAERTSICIDIDPLQQAQRDADPFRGANSTVDIWTNTVLKHSGESAKRTENIRVFSRELGAALVILGTIYTRILKSVVKQRTRDSAREKLFFTVCRCTDAV